MDAQNCAAGCCGAETRTRGLQRELTPRWWTGVALVVGSSVLACAAHVLSSLPWIPTALAAWYGTYQTIYSRGRSSCGAPIDEGAGPAELDSVQRSTRLRMAHKFLAVSMTFAVLAATFLPLLWPVAAITGWFAASFYVAVWTRYVGCPEVGAIPSWLSGHHVATRCVSART